MQHAHYLGDNPETLRRHPKPLIESIDQLSSDILPRML